MAACVLICVLLVIASSSATQDSKTSYIRVLNSWDATHNDYLYRNPYDYLLNTKTCFVPDYSRTIVFGKPSKPIPCSRRIVSVTPKGEDKIVLNIDYGNMKKTRRDSLQCCYNFMSPVFGNGHVDYAKCQYFKDGAIVKLEDEILEISCLFQMQSNMTVLSYKHTYQIPLKLESKTVQNDEFRSSYNVLMVGLEGMSRARAFAHMPHTAAYLRKENWLDFKGTFKVTEGTFDNVLAILTGKNSSSIKEMVAEGLNNKDFIWETYRNADYFTAFGEDNALHPNSLFNGLLDPAVDHHFSKTIYEPKLGRMICSKRESLEYAAQLANLYKKHKFLGFFWIHTIHNYLYTSLFDEKIFLYFFKRLKSDGVLNNTFVIFFSDSGMRYGKERITREAFYDNKLPMFFMSVPEKFRKDHPRKYKNLLINQGRLITLYDLHATLLAILRENNPELPNEVEACPDCQGLLEEVSSGRTCYEAFLEERWCSCFEMVDALDKKVLRTIMDLVINEMNSLASTTLTKPCTVCSPLVFKSIIRYDWYKSGDKKFYDIVFKVYQEDMIYEVKLEANEPEYNILFPIENLTPNISSGFCVNNTENAFDFALQNCLCVEDFRCNHLQKTKGVISGDFKYERSKATKTDGLRLYDYQDNRMKSVKNHWVRAQSRLPS